MSLNGFIPLDKPVGLSSQGAVTRVKNIAKADKAGHTGTLDPLASGLLLVALGRATRLCQYFLEGDKGYHAAIEFGIATDTGDRAGRIIDQAAGFFFRPADIAAALDRFRGQVQQIPPAASAIKIDGKRAYSLFRQGREPKLPPRQVEIKALDHLNPTDISPEQPVLTVDILCSKGTYIRSLARDLGEALGCPAHLAGLVRTKIGSIALSEAATLADLEQCVSPWLMDMAVAVEQLPRIELGPRESKHFIQGRRLDIPGFAGEIAVFSQGRLLGIAEAYGDQVGPKKVLVQET